MPKVALEIDLAAFVASVKEAEANGALANMSRLNEVVANLYNEKVKPTKPIQPGVIGLRLKEWKIETLTKPGKKGREAGVPLSDEQKAAMLAGRKNSQIKAKDKSNPLRARYIKEMTDRLRINDAMTYVSLVEKCADGKEKAIRKMQCLQCVGYSPKEVSICTDFACPQLLKRPYQKYDELVKLGNLELEDDEDDIDTEAA